MNSLLEEEKKLVSIKPLPEPKVEKVSSKIGIVKGILTPKADKPKKKIGRPRKPKKEKIEKHVMTDARKRGLLKARMVRMENIKKKKEAKAKAEAEAEAEAKSESMKKESMSMKKESVMPDKKSERENNLLDRIGKLELSLLDINSNMKKLLSTGSFKEGGQAKQTIPVQPSELKTGDITKPQKSFVNKSNGGQSLEFVSPAPTQEILNPNGFFF